ncbi:hypothetical protein OHA91_22885 [Streptomyces erythrochromogenes]|uniref:Uncharacterized protein n=1 Tax=Streptomyces erythrochromogenes TaxID=285574 RepID=A0ABZ1QEM4_9ACTN|nr:hypothetical protein [Streptomyces erythrochromogenes]
MSASITLHCNTVWSEAACIGAITIYCWTTDEARAAARAAGWRSHPGDVDYCPGCSGSRPRSPRASVTRLSRPPQQREPRP